MGLVDTVINMSDGHGAANSALGNLGRAAGGYANKIKSLTNKYDSPLNIRDIYTNGFLPGKINSETNSVQSVFAPKFFARAYDEPTYLTFRIEFIFEDDKRNRVYNNNDVFYKSLNGILPTYDFMPEPFLEDSVKVTNVDNEENNEKVKYFEGIEQTQQALDGSTHVENENGSSRYSTEHYLRKSLGEYRRANMLKTFKEALKDIQYVYPFYFTSISGLQNLTNVDPKRGMRLKDAVITIDCLEALDQRITYLLNLYRKIVWDDVYQRWVVPDMMRYFGMRIYVSEIRLFHTWIPNSRKSQENKYTNTIGALNNAIYPRNDKNPDYTIGAIQNTVAQGTAISNSFLGTQSNITRAVNLVSSAVDSAGEVYAGIKDIMNDLLAVDNAINHVMPTICYECHMCEFDISETMSHIDSLDSWNSRKSISPKIKIKVGQVREYQDYPLNRFLKMDNGVYKFDGTGNYNDSEEAKDVGIRLNDDLLSKRRPEYNESNIATETSQAIKNPSNPSERLNYTVDSDSPNGYSGKGIQNMKYSPELVTTKTSKMALTIALLNEGLDISRRFIDDDSSAGSIALDHLGRNSTATYPDKNNKNNSNAVRNTLQEEDRKYAENNATGIVYNEYINDDHFVADTVHGKGTQGNRKELEFEIQDTSIKSATEKSENENAKSGNKGISKVLYQRTGEESIDTLTENEKTHSDNYRKNLTYYENDTIDILTASEKESIENFSIDVPDTPEKEISNFYIAEPDESDTVTTQTDAEKANSSGYKNRFPDSGKSEATQIEEDVIAKSREEYKNSIKEFESQIFDETFGDDSASFPNIHNIDKVHALKDMLDAALEKIYKGGEIQSMAVSDQMKAKIAEDMFDEFLKDLEMSKATNNKTLKRFLSVYRTLQEEDKYGKSPATMKHESEDLRKKYTSAFEKLN